MRARIVTDDFDTDDIAVMRQRGVLPAFLRSRITRPGRLRRPNRPWDSSRAFGHRPGAWPSAAVPVLRHRPGPAAPVVCDCPLCRALAEHAETDSCRCAICVRRLLPAVA